MERPSIKEGCCIKEEGEDSHFLLALALHGTSFPALGLVFRRSSLLGVWQGTFRRKTPEFCGGSPRLVAFEQRGPVVVRPPARGREDFHQASQAPSARMVGALSMETTRAQPIGERLRQSKVYRAKRHERKDLFRMGCGQPEDQKRTSAAGTTPPWPGQWGLFRSRLVRHSSPGKPAAALLQ